MQVGRGGGMGVSHFLGAVTLVWESELGTC